MTKPTTTQSKDELSPELEQAVMEAIVGRNPVAYSKYGEETRERLVAVIQAEISKQREQAQQEREKELLDSLEYEIDKNYEPLAKLYIQNWISMKRSDKTVEGDT